MRHMLLGWGRPRAHGLEADSDRAAAESHAPTCLLDVARAAALPAVALLGLLAGVCCTSMLDHASEKPKLAEGSRVIRNGTNAPKVHATFIAHHEIAAP